jgi:hypothetical protein
MRKIKLPRYVLFHHDLQLMVFRPLGTLNEKVVEDIVAFLDQAENQAQKPFNRFSDLTQLDAIELEFEYVCRIALYRRMQYMKYPPVKSAFFATNKKAVELVTAHAVITEGSPLQIAAFKDLPAAATWLEVAVDDLRIGH